VTERIPKSARTRQRLAEVALDLFETAGYEATTTAQIAAAAGVSEMTLFRHFASKDRLLLNDPYDPVIADAVAQQPHDLPALARIANGVRASWRAIPAPAEAAVRRRLRIAATTPALAGAIRSHTRDTEAAVAHALTTTGIDPAVARTAAAAALGALTESLTEWAAAEDGSTIGDAIHRALGVLDEAGSR
jgi:AcrR family transcriptional regulator